MPLIFLIAVAGSQNYTCDAASGTYTLLGAEGTMLDDKVTGFVISAPIPGQGVGGIYTKTDPATNATVGSIAAVREDLVASPSNTTAIPWFIRQATATSGIYDGAEFIWRHDTLGGVLPEETNNCTVGQSEVVRVPYNAAYTVYKCGNGTAPSSGSMKVTVSVLALIAAGAVASTALVW